MKKQSKKQRFLVIQSLYAKVTLVLFILSSALVFLGYVFVKTITNAPQFIISFATLLFYYHIAHFIFGLSIVLAYFVFIRKRYGKIRIMAVVRSIVFTPISFAIAYIALFLLVISSCSA